MERARARKARLCPEETQRGPDGRAQAVGGICEGKLQQTDPPNGPKN